MDNCRIFLVDHERIENTTKTTIVVFLFDCFFFVDTANNPARYHQFYVVVGEVSMFLVFRVDLLCYSGYWKSVKSTAII